MSGERLVAAATARAALEADDGASAAGVAVARDALHSAIGQFCPP